MTYLKFKKLFIRTLEEYLSNQMPNRELVIQEVNKVNRKLTGFMIKEKDVINGAYPMYYLENLHTEFNRSSMSINAYVIYICDLLLKFEKDTKPKVKIDSEFIYKNVFPILMPSNNDTTDYITEKFLDMKVCYRVVIDTYDDTIRSFILTGLHYKEFDLSLEKIKEKAPSNFNNLFKPDLKPVDTTPFVILTTTRNIYGSSYIYEKNLIATIADDLDSDLWILPSDSDRIMLAPTKAVLSEKDLLTFHNILKDATNKYMESKDQNPSYNLTDGILLYSRDTHNYKLIKE